MHHATLDEDDNRLIALIDNDRALHDTPGHG
jgi:hypothetical protein